MPEYPVLGFGWLNLVDFERPKSENGRCVSQVAVQETRGVGHYFRAIAFAISVAAAGLAGAAERRAPDAAGAEFFEKRIRPLLAENCHQCHGLKKQESGLDLTSIDALLKGGDRGPPLVAGEPDKSILIQAIRYTDDDLKMPPRGKLKDEQIADLVAWVKMGAPGPLASVPSTSVASPSGNFDLNERRKHWAYQPVQDFALPAVKNVGWCSSPIDNFILARLEGAGLTPAVATERPALIRRLTFDLTGLPPSPSELEAFAADKSPDAYERAVDRLLASPRYGERWGRHWLDLVRYSETLGFEFDYDLYNAWRYRDYVIRAFNSDLPYNEFVIEHLAGDLLSWPRRNVADGCNESILATGFFWMLEGKQTPVDIRQEQADRMDNQIDVLGKAFLGQTIACARCHDHKFDAISTRDYYALAGYLKSSRYQQAFIDPPERIGAQVERLADLKAQIEQRARLKLAEVWKQQLSQAVRYLLAARSAERGAQSAEQGSAEKEKTADSAVTRTVIEQAAGEFKVDAARLEAWIKALAQESVSAPEHPLYVWAKIARGEEDTASKLRSSLQDRASQAEQLKLAARCFGHCGTDDDGGWSPTGDGFSALAKPGEIVVGDREERPVARLVMTQIDSGIISPKLQGEVRSGTFTIDKKYVHFRLAGQNARVNLVIDGYTLIMNPMYGKLTAAPAGDWPVWRTMPVDRWLGHQAYIEVSDSTIPMHGLNPPPSTARVPESKGDGYIALDPQVIFSDDALPPAAPSGINLAVLQKAAGLGVDAIAESYQQLMIEEIDHWRLAAKRSRSDTSDGFALLNWLLQNGLLDLASDTVKQSAGDADSLGNLWAQYRQFEASLPYPQRAPALADGTGEDEFVFLRGNYRTPGEAARRGPPEVLATLRNDTDGVPYGPPVGSGRLELARRLVDPANPLISRVIVNRLWQYHFGEGVVRTPDDFGRMGQPPTHPELLDFLAAELVGHQWSLKELNRRMVMTSAYRQRSEISGFRLSILDSNSGSPQSSNPKSQIPNPKLIDPENRLLSHMPVHRLEAEAVRDSILVVSGSLSSTMHGPSVLPYVTPYMEGRGKPNSGALDGEGRRSIYLNARRNFLTPLLLAFDYPVTFTPIGRRGTSAIPAQALSLMNDPFVLQQAGKWAQRVLDEGESSVEGRIDSMYRSAFARPPTDEEQRDAIDFLQAQSLRHGTSSENLRVWTDLCHVLMNVKEFIFVE
jgi:mono/diheme cytochrome c family protein